jgi:hypothetical protein
MKMKQLFRAVVLVLLVGGWSLAASAVHVIRTPTNIALVPKDRLAFHDTWLDTRKWTLVDDSAHPAVVARLVHLGRADLLRHTLPGVTDPDASLAAIAAGQPAPGVATSTAAGTIVKSAEGDFKTVVDLAKDKAGRL